MAATTCYVELLDEGVEVWRPTAAYAVDDDVYVLSNENHDPETEKWAVAPGSLVRLVERTVSGDYGQTELVLVAELADAPKETLQ